MTEMVDAKGRHVSPLRAIERSSPFSAQLMSVTRNEIREAADITTASYIATVCRDNTD